MSTECNRESYDFGRVEGRRLVADFGGGTLSSNGGALLLRQVAKATGLLDRLAGCFTDQRSEDRVEYGVPTLLGQRLFGLALGFFHQVVVINGVTMKVKAAHVRLCHSRMMFVRVYPRESQKRP